MVDYDDLNSPVVDVLKKEWHEKYKRRLMESANLTEGQAQDILEAGMDDHDYRDDPKYAADMELSYWG